MNIVDSKEQFLKTDRGKTKQEPVDVPSIALPKGGGAIKGIDEKLSVNAVNGTASFSIPLPWSPARGVTPSLSLSYNSGFGNGIFGLGWQLDQPSIKRKTDKELPQYCDLADSDTYVFSEAEDLVAEFEKEASGAFPKDDDGAYLFRETDSADKLFRIRYYRPRVEGLFARIERWTEKSSREIRWRIISKENVTTLYGWSDASRINDPGDKTRIYQWLPEFVFDDKGNCCHYLYQSEDSKGFDPALLHNQNRSPAGDLTYTNLYLQKVRYGNRTPYRSINTAFPPEAEYLFQIAFDYGEYDTDEPYQKSGDWDFRSDAFSEYKAGFEIRTTRLCKRVLLFHYFDELPGGSALVKSLNFDYDCSQQAFTFLKSITAFGYIKKPDGNYSSKCLPSTEFAYQPHEWNRTVRTIAVEELAQAPAGLDEPAYQFTDLFGEGLAGILTEQGEGWFYKHNLGDGRFAAAKVIAPKPSFAGLGQRLQLMDLDADGSKQLVSLRTEPKGYFELSDLGEWRPFRPFPSLPNIDLGDSNTRLIDLNGDGRPEAVVSEDSVFTWFESAGRKGYEAARTTDKAFDEESGPHLVFADPQQTIFLADMSGDGLTDIVRIRNGEVCYWPNLGYGRFGSKVAMDNAPVFDHPDAFNPSYLRLADIDGSGTTDIIYLGKNRLSCWLNLSGNSFSTDPFQIEGFPEIHNSGKVSVTDLLGNGVACIVWSSPLSKDAGAPLRYIDLMNGKKPYLMVSYRNNLGKEVALEYTPSTRFYLDDKLAGRPWVTKLHFPVHCISRTETRDAVSGHRFVSAYKYRHGYYDHAEREFRGFGMVEQTDTEHFEHWVKSPAGNVVDRELHQDPVITKSWFHTGAFLGQDGILTLLSRDYWYEVMAAAGFAEAHQETALPDARIVCAPEVDPTLLDRLDPQHWREALRACKGMALRSELFARDAPLTGATADQIRKELTPYSVAAHNCVIELLQPKGQNKHAVFVVKESEAVTYSYERDPEDPRISHTLNVKVDQYGNVIESASVVYPRLQHDPALPAETQDAQSRALITYSLTRFTNDVDNTDAYRLRLASEVTSYQLKGITRATPLYSVSDFDDVLAAAAEVEYHQVDADPPAGTIQKRMIEQVRTLFRDQDLKSPRALHELDPLALRYESYQLAYTPTLIDDIFGPKVDASLMQDGKFTRFAGEDTWWIRSGTTQYLEGAETRADAENRFFMPTSYVDPFGATSKVGYYGDDFLLVEKVEDALGNKQKVEQFNWHTLAPRKMKDANGNFSEVLVDELGLVKAMALYGKGQEADDLVGLNDFTSVAEQTLASDFLNAAASDVLVAHAKELLQHATCRFVYNFGAYADSGGPAVAATIVREEHFKNNANAPIQVSFEYSSGTGTVLMKKVQAEPGLAKQVTVAADDSYSVTDVDTSLSNPKQLRWIGSGRTVLNNKGKAVKQYEPYFSVTHRFEALKELVESGVTPVMYHDPVGRLVKTKLPDGTFIRTKIDSWRQLIFDANDTVKESAWYENRINHQIDIELIAAGKDPDKEKEAAQKAAKHADTPIIQHFDTLGRPVLSVEHNINVDDDTDEYYLMLVDLDIEGNLRKVTDARGNVVMRHKYDLLGNKIYQDSMDAGKRWLLANIMGNPLRVWDERDYEFQYFYDVLHRPTLSKVVGGDGDDPLDHIFARTFYGEAESDAESKNLRGRVVRQYDSGGMIETPEYDFKGLPKYSTRRLFKKYREVVNWIDANLAGDLEPESFTFSSKFDAIGRICRQTAPDGSVITPSYNEAGLLDSESVAHAEPAIDTVYLKGVDYNEKGQRKKIVYGNNVVTTFEYDTETFRLIRLQTRRSNNDPLQDIRYTYDPVGNITHVEDKNVPLVFFDNQKIVGLSTYTYDALYRLVEATGRENEVPLSFDGKDNWNDKPFLLQANPGDPLAMRNYTQSYQYDSVGNIRQMQHQAAGNSWTRDYTYQPGNNRLVKTMVGGTTYSYTHHAKHGFMTQMPHLEEMGWNFKEELVKSVRQRRTDGGTPETTYYQYDGQGRRIRKVTENEAAPGQVPALKNERFYIEGYELFRKHSGQDAGLERRTLSLLDKKHRFVLVETRNDVDDGTEKHLVRYQLHNHQGSACLELYGTVAAKVISYEEYHPFGTTAYQARNAAIKSAAKRYRYTGMERDDETGLEYHSARYYLPWLGRWGSADPIGLMGGINAFRYANDNPIMARDPSGTDGETCGVWDEESQTCYAEPCPVQSEPSYEAPPPAAPPTIRVKKKAAPKPPPPSPEQSGAPSTVALTISTGQYLYSRAVGPVNTQGERLTGTYYLWSGDANKTAAKTMIAQEGGWLMSQTPQHVAAASQFAAALRREAATLFPGQTFTDQQLFAMAGTKISLPTAEMRAIWDPPSADVARRAVMGGLPVQGNLVSPAGPGTVQARIELPEVRSSGALMGGLQMGAGALNIYGGMQEKDELLSTLGIGGGGLQVAGGATWIAGAYRASAPLMSAGSKMTVVGTVVTAPIVLAHAKSEIESGNEYLQMKGTMRAVGVVAPPAAVLVAYQEVFVEPAAKTFSEAFVGWLYSMGFPMY